MFNQPVNQSMRRFDGRQRTLVFLVLGPNQVSKDNGYASLGMTISGHANHCISIT